MGQQASELATERTSNQTGIQLERDNVERFRLARKIFLRMLKARVEKEGTNPFVIDEQIRQPLEIFIAWASCHEAHLKALGAHFSVYKGILLRGNVGSGKSILFRTLRDINQDDEMRVLFRPMIYTSCEGVAKQYQMGGDKFIEKYTTDAVKRDEYSRLTLAHACFDDLGNEEPKKHYGNFKEVMKDVICERYDYHVDHHLCTSFTTNLTMDEIKVRYDERTRSRIEQMCNIVGIGSSENYLDRRQSL